MTTEKRKVMTLDDYKKHIDRLVKEGHGDKNVIYSCDDEGNSFHPVFYTPSVYGEEILVNQRQQR